MKKLLTLALSLLMIMSVCLTGAIAEEGSVVIENNGRTTTYDSVPERVVVLSFLTMDEDFFLHLTDLGREIAEQTYEKHRFFMDLLTKAGVDPASAERDACRMEHAISEESFVRLKVFMDVGRAKKY